MGRHRAEPIKTSKPEGKAATRPVLPQRRSPELLAWGVFLTAVAAGGMLWVEVPHGTLAAASALLFLAFGLSWFFAPPRTTTAAGATAPAPALPAPAPAPAPAAPAPAAVPVPLTAAAATRPDSAPASTHPGTRPVARTRNAPHGRRAAAAPVLMPAEPSRWTRTFGPPDTGQIPLQPYLAGMPASYATADSSLPDRRQRSHSSL